MNLKLLGAILGSLLIVTSCQKKAPAPDKDIVIEVPKPVMGNKEKAVTASVTPASEENPEHEKGRLLYKTNCLQCHNKDPNIKGAVGPEIVDAPLEVMTAKVMTSYYPDPLPAGFVPKRKSHAMRAIPKLKNDIPLIWAYVQSVKKKN